jgi:hypothetical protein
MRRDVDVDGCLNDYCLYRQFTTTFQLINNRRNLACGTVFLMCNTSRLGGLKTTTSFLKRKGKKTGEAREAGKQNPVRDGDNH